MAVVTNSIHRTLMVTPAEPSRRTVYLEGRGTVQLAADVPALQTFLGRLCRDEFYCGQLESGLLQGPVQGSMLLARAE